LIVTKRHLRRLIQEAQGDWQAFLATVDALREACSEAIGAGSAAGVSARLMNRLEKIDDELYELRAELE
jgi:phosphopantetheinyl transferase (holo-ACP synthase)